MKPTLILQTYLDVVADAVLAGDYATYRAHVVLPFHLVTHTANLTISTETDLQTGFETFHQTLRAQRITQYIRLVDTAAALDPDLISGRYVTHLMAGGHRILDPYQSQITLRRVGDLWRAASITNALANSRWPLLLPSILDTSTQKGPEQ